MTRQRGLSLFGLILVAILVVMVAIVGMKVAPSVIEYFTILKDVKAIANSSDMQSATVADVRKAFERRTEIDAITSIDPGDLDISKQGNQVVIGFAYSKKIHIVGNVSLLIDYQGSTAPGG